MSLSLNVSLAEASDHTEQCPVALECGGCPMIGLSERVQLDRKLAVVTAALSDAGLVFPEPRWVRSGARMGYRNRLRLRFDADGRLGYFNPGKADDCGVVEPALARSILRIKAFSLLNAERTRSFAHVEVRSPDADGRSGACFSARPGMRVSEAALSPLAAVDSDILFAVEGATLPEAVPRQRWVLSEDVYCYVPLDAFVQVNTSVNRSLCATLRGLCRSHGVTSALDLYAGSGNFTLPLLRDGISVTAVEAHASAVHALRCAAAVQGLGPLDSVVGDAAEGAQAFHDRGRQWDLVVVDAPRAGVRKGLRTMARLARQHMALVSCNPRTLARDSKALSECGFAVREVLLFDMFAQTRHVETLAWLSRG